MLIAIGGMSGTGKSTLAAALASRLTDAVHMDSDRTRKELFGVSETTRLPPEAYTPEATERLIAEMDRRIRDCLSQGKTVVVSSTFLSEGAGERQQKIAEAVGVRFVGILLEADLNTLFDRVAKRVNDASDAGVDILQAQTKVGVTFADNWARVNSSGKREDVLQSVIDIVTETPVTDTCLVPPRPKPR